MPRAVGSKTMGIHISKDSAIDKELYNYYWEDRRNRKRIKSILYKNMIIELQNSKNF